MPSKEEQEALERLLKPKLPKIERKEPEKKEKNQEKKEREEEFGVSESRFNIIDIPAPVLQPAGEVEARSLEDLTREARQERLASERQRRDERGREIKTEDELIKYGPSIYEAEQRRVDAIGQINDMRRTGTFFQKQDPFQLTERQRVITPDLTGTPDNRLAEDMIKYVEDKAVDLMDTWKQDDLIKRPEDLRKYKKR
ncbi:hypothetical protein HZA33_04150 [Candidatus Pacearchaeota archaeon]|nr:hypothetical protein [Candidatus Pacearchaeota archaeon]